jgi:hypothetical protein
MKKVGTILLGMLAITGLVITGSEAVTIPKQFIACTIGIIFFSCSMFALIAINKGE